MTAQPQILVVGNDPSLAEEFEAAVAGLRGYQPVAALRGRFSSGGRGNPQLAAPTGPGRHDRRPRAAQAFDA